MSTPQDTADEYARLQRAAHQMLDTADQAARDNNPQREQRAVQAAGRLLDQANRL